MSNPTVLPADPFDAAEDAKTLKKAFKGFGSDEKAIIGVIAKRSLEQRMEIVKEFKTLYGEDLLEELKSELRGNFEDVIVALMTNPVDFQAKALYKALSGLGTDEDTLVEVLAIHDNEEVKVISTVYEELYETSLESDIKGDTSGTVKRLFVSLSVGGRDESEHTNRELAYKDAQTLLRAGELIQGTDESTFNAILCQRNRSQLKLIFEEYEKLTGHEFEQAIKNEFSGTAKSTLLNLIHCIRDKYDYLATRLHKSMDRLGTDDRTLIRIIVSRSEIDLGTIKQVFESKYGKSLADWITDDTSGDYKRCLLEIVG
ncbi:PREDICTED: annexin B9-like isoform X2 [Nicrophorus vespilloides]|nr:PREDICTED: annexin B9-like isoform X2 [Nicrophorus vespilloides]